MALILTVAGDEAFANLLKDGLEKLGKHQVIVTLSEREAARIVSEKDIDLVIIDVDLGHLEPVKLARVMRQIKPDLRMMWMPFLGYDLSEEMQAVNVQGILTKPFFMEELPDKIERALSGKETESQPAETAAATTEIGFGVSSAEQRTEGLPISSAVLGQTDQAARPAQASGPPASPDAAATEILNRLALELDAESVVILNRTGDLLAQAGHMNKRQATELSSVLTDEVVASSNVATFLKEKIGFFMNSIHEGEQFRLFSVILPGTSLALSVITRVDIPLGTVRYHVRQAAASLAAAFHEH